MGKVKRILGKLGDGFRLAADVAGDVVKGAGTGATIGSLIPGVGTAVGAVVGASVAVVRHVADGEVHRDPEDPSGTVRVAATGPAVVRTLTLLGRKARGLPPDVSYAHRATPDLGVQLAPLQGYAAAQLVQWYAGNRTVEGAGVLLWCRLLDHVDSADPHVYAARHQLQARTGPAFSVRSRIVGGV